jgi:hypothetical protein
MVADSGSYWLWSAGTSFTLCCALVGADAMVDTAKPHFSLWTSPIAILAYSTVVASLACLICQIRDVHFPFAARGSRREKVWLITASADTDGSMQDQPVFIEKAPRGFMAEFKGRTSAEVARISAPYNSQTMRFSGVLVDVGDWTGSCAQAEIIPYSRRPTIFATFSDKEVSDRQLAILDSGTRLTIRGQIERIELARIILSDCAILSIDR